MTAFELRPTSSPAQTENVQLDWPSTRRGDGAVHSQLTPFLAELGVVPDAAIDLVRFATAAYLADERIARPISFTRSVELDVQLVNAPAWNDDVLGNLADLLESTTGDSWQLAALAADPAERPATLDANPPPVARVALLSGGLDSLAGAALTSEAGDAAYLGHWDIPTVKAAQDKVRRRFETAGRAIDYVQIYHALHAGKVEHSQRTRSLLFMSLAVALAATRGARLVDVPENGFTSLNPPLGPERGGPLTTRSTHPMTISRFNVLLRDLGIDVIVRNPYQWQTKGELVAMAAPHLPDFEVAVSETLSCAKLDGGRYKGGDWNKHCGLCYACLVRRGAVLASGVTDLTDYLSETLPDPSRQKLVARRGADIVAVGMLLETGVDDIDVLTLGPFPPDFDLDADLGRAVDLCRRALDEIRRVRLP
jgi:7-cyano-7-deazaguanine synthase in queuosine biosynthesis